MSNSNAGSGYWYEKNNTIKISLLDSEAEKEAKEWAKGTGDFGALKEGKNQVRKYFNEVKNIQRDLKTKSAAWETILPRIKMLKSKVVYDSNRDNSKLPKAFASFLTDRIGKIDKEQDFDAFVLHFEACLGFFYGAKV